MKTLYLNIPDKSGRFSIQSARDTIRPLGERVIWSHLVWWPGRILKASFCLWLAIKERLYTQDRMPIADPFLKCHLCSNHTENHKHLFFQCTISNHLWSMVQTKCGITTPVTDWPDLISWCSKKWTHTDIISSSWKLCLAATVYQIWHERNHRLHNGSTNTILQIRDKIFDMVRLKLSVLRKVPDTPDNKGLAAIWNLPSSIFTM